MSNLEKRVKRFALLAQLQKTTVQQAAQRYRASLQGLAQANEKLAGLEGYFESRPEAAGRQVNAVALAEASVFASRLQSAIVAQRALCEQRVEQCEIARQLVLQAEQRRSGLDKTKTSVEARLISARHQKEQRVVEDAIMARYCRSS